MFTPSNLTEIVKNIVDQANHAVHKHTGVHHLSVNYACVFSKDGDFQFWLQAAKQLGKIVKETDMGPVFELTEPIPTKPSTDITKSDIASATIAKDILAGNERLILEGIG